MKKNNIKTRVIGTVLATICALSAGAAITAVSANAATAPATVSAGVKAKACKMTFKGGTSYGYDWDYRADSTAAKISCPTILRQRPTPTERLVSTPESQTRLSSTLHRTASGTMFLFASNAFT